MDPVGRQAEGARVGGGKERPGEREGDSPGLPGSLRLAWWAPKRCPDVQGSPRARPSPLPPLSTAPVPPEAPKSRGSGHARPVTRPAKEPDLRPGEAAPKRVQ